MQEVFDRIKAALTALPPDTKLAYDGSLREGCGCLLVQLTRFPVSSLEGVAALDFDRLVAHSNRTFKVPKKLRDIELIQQVIYAYDAAMNEYDREKNRVVSGFVTAKAVLESWSYIVKLTQKFVKESQGA
jgi:hypothetical protein